MSNIAQLAAASAQAACRLAKEKVRPFEERSQPYVTSAQYLRGNCVQMLLVSLLIDYRSGLVDDSPLAPSRQT